jgi:hypothetical protein
MGIKIRKEAHIRMAPEFGEKMESMLSAYGDIIL